MPSRTDHLMARAYQTAGRSKRRQTRRIRSLIGILRRPKPTALIIETRSLEKADRGVPFQGSRGRELTVVVVARVGIFSEHSVEYPFFFVVCAGSSRGAITRLETLSMRRPSESTMPAALLCWRALLLSESYRPDNSCGALRDRYETRGPGSGNCEESNGHHLSAAGKQDEEVASPDSSHNGTADHHHASRKI